VGNLIATITLYYSINKVVAIMDVECYSICLGMAGGYCI